MPSELRPRPPWRLAADHPTFPRAPFAELLTFEGSLTSELTRLGGGDFELQLIAQAAVSDAEADALLEHERDERWLPALCREVMMYVAGRPVVAARTLVPERTAHAQGWLSELGGRSLGHALFERDDVTRSPFTFSSCEAHTDLVQRVRSLAPAALGAVDGALWARRSRFQVGEHPLLVMELFLPDAVMLAQPEASVSAAP